MLDISSPLGLEHEFARIPSLRGLLLSVMPDGLLYDAHVAQGSGISTDEVCSLLGEVLQQSEQLLRAFRCPPGGDITIESKGGVAVVRPLTGQFVVGILFAPQTPLALVRTYTDHLVSTLQAQLGQAEAPNPQEAISNAVRVLRYLKQYAPDPHTALMRIALKTGIPIATLNEPQLLDEGQTAKIEQAVCEVLGLDELVL